MNHHCVALVCVFLQAVTVLADNPLTPAQRQELEKQVRELDADAQRLYQSGNPAQAAVQARQILAVLQRLHGNADHREVALAMSNLGVYLRSSGRAAEAVLTYQKSVDMLQRLYPASQFADGHVDLAFGLNNLGYALHASGQSNKARPILEQALAMRERLYPADRFKDGHLNLVHSLDNMGMVTKALGEFNQALVYYERSLAMAEKLFPVERYKLRHVQVATSQNNLASCLQAMGRTVQAKPHYEKALEIYCGLYSGQQFPNGHPHVALTLNNLGTLMFAARQYQEAIPYYEKSLIMREKLFSTERFPLGHPELASSLSNLARAYAAMGQFRRGLPLQQRAVAMIERIFPAEQFRHGHPFLLISLHGLAGLHHGLGEHDKALLLYQRAMTSHRRQAALMIETATETEALSYLQAQPTVLDDLLSLTAHLPDSAAAAYESVWFSKSAVLRVLEQRQAAARAADPATSAVLANYKQAGRSIEQVFATRMPAAERDKLLATLTSERDRLERELARALPRFQRAREVNALGPDALVAALPEHTAFLDIVAYTRFDYDRSNPERIKELRAPAYATFILTRAKSIVRVDLGDAQPIDRAIAQWRSSITSPTPGNSAAPQLRELLWSKLAAHIPKGTTTLYLSVDKDLARLSWAALPTSTDRVLLEDFALAQVPHGAFLLEQLKYPRKSRNNESMLVMGGVDYGSGDWPALPGTIVERDAVAQLHTGKPRSLSGREATAQKLRDELAHVQYAHLATHGEFKADEYRAERQRVAEALASRVPGEPVRFGTARNPLAYVGLILSLGESMSGLSILDLPLENLNLVTLSACETGLGEYTGGKGVENLQLAFHLAGCPNVVASLWRVEDKSTAALMAKFYHEMWINKKPPMESLREAQLMVYRHPELIPDLAGERGVPKLKEAVVMKSEPRALTSGAKRSDTKLWAAFILSGVGK